MGQAGEAHRRGPWRGGRLRYHDDVNWLCHVGVYKDENGEVSYKKIEIPDAWKGDLSEAHEKRYVLLFPGEAEAMGISTDKA